MSRWSKQAFLLTTICLLASRTPAAVPDAAQPHLKLVVIVSRHGVRSPTWTQARLDSYSALPWPKWSVPPGNLTVRGHQLLTLFGKYDRMTLAANGLLAANGCGDAAATYIYADTGKRTIESGRALTEGLFPGCPPALHGLPEGENDPLFHPAANGVAPADADEAFAQLSAQLKLREDPKQGDPAGKGEQFLLIDQMQQVLRGCAPEVTCTPKRQPPNLIVGAPTAPLRGKGDHMIDLQGPLALASTFAEDFLLEYADGMPMKDVGWGNVDEAQISRFMSLHSDYFALMHRTPAAAQAEASNMLFHIERTLEQAASGKPLPDAVGPADAKLVVLVGHDTNLAAMAELLGAHWKLDGREDDTPPGAQLAFQLWQKSKGKYTVRFSVAMQTLEQLRELSPELPAATAAEQIELPLPGCSAPFGGCTLGEFQQLTERVVRKSAVYPLKMP